MWAIIILSPPFWFFRNNSGTVKGVTLAFCNIQKHFIRYIHVKFGIPNLPQSPDIGRNSDEGISDFRIFGRSFINENCHNSRTNNGIDMKLGPVTKLGKKNTASSKKSDDDVMSKNYDVIVFSNLWSIWSNAEAGFRTHGL